MAGAVIAPALNLIREGLGASPASVGLIITTHSLSIAIFSPLIGNLIDRIGTKKPYIFGLLLYALAGGSGLVITSYWLLIVSRVIFGFAVAAVLNSITVMILNLYKGSGRDKIMGWRGSANSFGGLIWPLIGGFLGGFSWHLPFSVYLLGLPLGLLALITIPETHNEKIKDVSNDGSVVSILKNNPILYTIFGLFCWAWILHYVIVVFLPQLLETIGISKPFYISLFLSGTPLSAGLTSLMYGKIKSKLSYKTILLVTLALWTIGFITISQVLSVMIIAFAVILIGIGRGVVIPALMVWVGEIVPISSRGKIVAFMATFGYVGQFLSPVLFSPVLSLSGLNGIFLVGGAICAPLFLLLLVRLRTGAG